MSTELPIACAQTELNLVRLLIESDEISKVQTIRIIERDKAWQRLRSSRLNRID